MEVDLDQEKNISSSNLNNREMVQLNEHNLKGSSQERESKNDQMAGVAVQSRQTL